MLVSQILKNKGDSVYHPARRRKPSRRRRRCCIRSGVGALVVMDADHVVGIVSERDVVRVDGREGRRGAGRSRSPAS